MAWLVAAPASAQEVEFGAERDGEYVSVWARTELPVDARSAFSVLTDYERLAEFIPDLKSSRVLSRDGATVVVEQKGEYGVLFFRQAIDLRLVVTEEPPLRVSSRSTGGSLKNYSGSYELRVLPPAPAAMQGTGPAGPRTRIDYRGRFIPAFDLPPVLGMMAVRESLRLHFGAMAREIVRRAGVQVRPPDADLPW